MPLRFCGCENPLSAASLRNSRDGSWSVTSLLTYLLLRSVPALGDASLGGGRCNGPNILASREVAKLMLSLVSLRRPPPLFLGPNPTVLPEVLHPDCRATSGRQKDARPRRHPRKASCGNTMGTINDNSAPGGTYAHRTALLPIALS